MKKGFWMVATLVVCFGVAVCSVPAFAAEEVDYIRLPENTRAYLVTPDDTVELKKIEGSVGIAHNIGEPNSKVLIYGPTSFTTVWFFVKGKETYPLKLTVDILDHPETGLLSIFRSGAEPVEGIEFQSPERVLQFSAESRFRQIAEPRLVFAMHELLRGGEVSPGTDAFNKALLDFLESEDGNYWPFLGFSDLQTFKPIPVK